MTSPAGIDLLRGRPTAPISSTEAKLQQRKLDALKRGVHRISDPEQLPFGVHLIGVGGAGAHVLECFLREAPDDILAVPGSRLSLLAVDIGDQDLVGVRDQAHRFGDQNASIETLALEIPGAAQLDDSLVRLPEFLQLEYPLYNWNPDFEPWISPNAKLPQPGARISRALAKAVYSSAYYDQNQPAKTALQRFASSVEAAEGDAVVCFVFGLGGGTGSGIALDMARHLSAVMFGRRVLVTGIGIGPHDGDDPQHTGAQLFTSLAELDVLCDEEKNRGVTQSCGDLYKNPFTAGFLVVPQPSGGSQAETHAHVNSALTALLSLRHGANLWEALRLLNWVAAPSTQHSAARTPWGSRWIHLFGFGDVGAAPAETDLAPLLGLLPDYAPEYIELRAADGADEALTTAWANALNSALRPEVPPLKVGGGAPGTIQFVLPRVSKDNLLHFHGARAAYDALDERARLATHALLLEQGVVLCEPSSRLPGMAGRGIGNSQQWVAVPLAALRGEPEHA